MPAFGTGLQLNPLRRRKAASSPDRHLPPSRGPRVRCRLGAAVSPVSRPVLGRPLWKWRVREGELRDEVVDAGQVERGLGVQDELRVDVEAAAGVERRPMT